MTKEILGFYKNGNPIHENVPGQITTQAFIFCDRCRKVIKSTSGPAWGSLCLDCAPKGECKFHWAFHAIQALKLYIDLVESKHTAAGRTHLQSMLERTNEEMSIGKLNRWLGWIQACLVIDGIVTLEMMKAHNKHFSDQEQKKTWRDMSSAPKNGTMVRLLVEFTEHATEDSPNPSPTIGANNFDNDGEDKWLFAGWCWTHDHFTEGKGTPIGWLPMLGE